MPIGERQTIDGVRQEMWRLGLLLTGSEDGASEALVRVLGAHDNILRLSEDRRRRLVVLGAREWRARVAGIEGDDGSPEGRASRLASSLESLPREAWALRDVRQWSDAEASRAMGVARSAVATYLAEARAKLNAALGEDYPAAVAALRRRWESMDVSQGVSRAVQRSRGKARRRRVLALVKLLVLLSALAAISWIGSDLLDASKRERSFKALQDAVSNPIPERPAPTPPRGGPSEDKP